MLGLHSGLAHWTWPKNCHASPARTKTAGRPFAKASAGNLCFCRTHWLVYVNREAIDDEQLPSHRNGFGCCAGNRCACLGASTIHPKSLYSAVQRLQSVAIRDWFHSIQPLNTIDDEPDAAIDFPNGALCAAGANAIVIFSGDFFIRAIRNERECRRAEDRPARSP